MPNQLSSDFNAKAEEVAEIVFDISDKKLGSHQRQAIVEALDALNITPEQEAVIEKYASPTYRALEDQNDTPAKRLAHTLRDPIGKLIASIQYMDMFDDPNQTFSDLVNMDRLIDAQTHNYNMIFSGDVPPQIDDVLKTLENELKPRVQDMIMEMENTYGLNRDDVETKTKGWEHVGIVPADEYEAAVPV